MKNIIIVGASGFGKEVLQIVKEINKQKLIWNILGFIDDNPDLSGSIINDYKVLGNLEYVRNFDECSIVIAITNPLQKESILNKLNSYENNFFYPNIIHPSVNLSLDTNKIGHGNIITIGCILTTNISIGNFNTLNTRTTIGHDVIVESFNIMNPNVQISGNVAIGSSNFFAVNSVILQGLKVGSYNNIGACSLVLRNIKDNTRVFGVPAQKIKF